ncbi:allantoate permease [Penicillium brasilianum]|uniref:Allantoate permease n=1 Tax=Penicillium brasilianum TaxID=104259 RepID=A0A1S9RAE9_PENBI|nr:allantoate permease [Penicillium brasilianum]
MGKVDGKPTSVVALSENYPKEHAINYGTLEQSGERTEKNNPFLDPEVAEYWRGVYEKAHYECRDLFDPTLTWTEEEERLLVRKLDWRICLWACVMFFALQVDRGNLVQAVSDTFLADLKLNTNDYNIGNIVFRLSFLVAELPSQLISKKIGPDRWIPIQMVLWSVVAISQCALTDRKTFLLTRSLLGILEGGFIPDIVLWLSYFYTSRELPIRLSFFWTSLSVTTIVTSLLAFAVFHLGGVHGWAGWRWLFLIEGLITLSIGLASFFMMPASVVQTKTWFRPNGWFTDREVAIVANRVLRDDPSKGDMHNRQAVTPRRLWNAIKDYNMWPIYFIGVVVYIPQSPPSSYITLTLRSLGFNKFHTNLLTIPANVFHIGNLLLITWVSSRLNQWSLVAMFQALWTLPCLLTLRFWPDVISNAWGTYAVVTVLLSYPYCHAIVVAWVSRNANNVGNRSVAAALYNMSVQAGDVAAYFIYREDDKPKYRRGNTDLIAINILAIALFIAAKAYYVFQNRRRDRIWSAMSEQERNEYIRNTEDQGSSRLDFRFAH